MDEISRTLRESDFPRTVRHHALIVYRLMLRKTGKNCLGYAPPTVACACLLYAIKERNRTNLAHSLRELRKRCTESDVVALEMWFMEALQEKVILVEACVRVAYKQFAECNSHLSSYGEELISVALVFVEHQYDSDDCLRPERGARSAIVAAAAALGWENCSIPESWLANGLLPVARS